MLGIAPKTRRTLYKETIHSHTPTYILYVMKIFMMVTVWVKIVHDNSLKQSTPSDYHQGRKYKKCCPNVWSWAREPVYTVAYTSFPNAGVLAIIITHQ